MYSKTILASVSFWPLLIIESVARLLQHVLFTHDFLVKATITAEIYRPYSFVLMLRYCANLKAIRYESTSLNRIVAHKSHRVVEV